MYGNERKNYIKIQKISSIIILKYFISEIQTILSIIKVKINSNN